ncbi:nuclear transport factor 2 family protein, partial [Chloroflexota bacterium]
EVIELFSDDPATSVEINDSGVFVGKESIKRFFWRDDKISPHFLHVLMQVNEVINIDPDGKTAKGRWYGFGPHAIPTDGEVQAAFSCGIYENDYVKENSKWKFKKILWSRIFYTPYEDGWVKTPVKTLNFAKVMGKEQPKPDRPTTVYHPYPSGYIFPYHFKHPITGK